ncbi:hypothetical protein Q1695_008021 [Nippostrongylus brasiliensis]|nr:hypothetical protein Q1695_008021 [Nippostrongylus brasiliensis]
MQLATARPQNVLSEEENLTTKGKKQAMNTPRRALGNMKNMSTPNRTSLKATKPTLHGTGTYLDFSSSPEQKVVKSHFSAHPPLAHLEEDDDDVIEGCNREEVDHFGDECFVVKSNDVLIDAENDAEYFAKLISMEGCGGLSDDEDLPIESCGPEADPDNYDDIFTESVELVGDEPIVFEKIDETGLDQAKQYTIEEMEKLFDSFNDVFVF